MRILKIHPLISLSNGYLVGSPQPSNLNYLWKFGSLLGFCLVIQIVIGVTLAMHYNTSVLEAFNSVEHIMRDVNNGWLILYLLSNTAPAFFFIVYLCVSGNYVILSPSPYSIFKCLIIILLFIILLSIFVLFMLNVLGFNVEFSDIVFIKREIPELPSIKSEGSGSPTPMPGSDPHISPPAHLIDNNAWMKRLSIYLQEQQIAHNNRNLILNDLRIRFTSDPSIVNVSQFPHSHIHRLRVEHPNFFENFAGRTLVGSLIQDIDSVL